MEDYVYFESVIGSVKSRKMRWAENVTRVVEIRNTHKLQKEKISRKKTFGLAVSTILK
jgi:hypothetical protein